MQIKHVGVLSLAKFYSVMMAVFGLIFGVIYGLIFMVVGGAIMAGGGRGAGNAGAGSFAIGLIMMVAIPITSGILGFIGGALGAVIYNVASGFIGGIELELENMDTAGYTAPPSPDWTDKQPYQPGQQQYPY
jgi:hypothetical protein